MIRRTRRPGFTLLEVLLASAIGLLLLSALYVAVDNQISQSQAARDIVEQSTLARALLNRMETDILSTVNLSDPGRYRILNSTPPTTFVGSTANSSSGATTTTPATTTPAATDASGMPTTASGSGNATPVILPMGLVGDNTSLHLFVTRVPRDAVNANYTDIPPPACDTHRISYWLVDGGDGPGSGLAKQEVTLVTSDDVMINIPPGIPDENQKIIAEEVRTLSFQYFDGTTWNDTWDSYTIGNDGLTPIGPPVAISIDIDFALGTGPDAKTKHYRHVVAIGMANGGTPFTPPTTGGGTTSP